MESSQRPSPSDRPVFHVSPSEGWLNDPNVREAVDLLMYHPRSLVYQHLKSSFCSCNPNTVATTGAYVLQWSLSHVLPALAWQLSLGLWLGLGACC
jgi:hypothetical protein